MYDTGCVTTTGRSQISRTREEMSSKYEWKKAILALEWIYH